MRPTSNFVLDDNGNGTIVTDRFSYGIHLGGRVIVTVNLDASAVTGSAYQVVTK